MSRVKLLRHRAEPSPVSAHQYKEALWPCRDGWQLTASLRFHKLEWTAQREAQLLWEEEQGSAEQLVSS